jgi:pSer/pThr/pTyr-binding forkhead associated (FHA) protein
MPSLALTISREPGEGPETGAYRYQFDKEEILVGRDPATDVRLPHSSVSLVHLRLRWRQGAWYAEDADSTNGTFLNGRRLTPGERGLAAEGSRLTAGPFVLHLGGEPQQPTAPEDTARFARQMVLEILGAMEEQRHPSLQVDNGPERGQLLQISTADAALVVGRGAEADLRISDADASRRHVELTFSGGAVVARDLDSKNGTLLNDLPLDAARPLDQDDVLVIGQTRLRFSDPAERYLQGLQEEREEQEGLLEAPAARGAGSEGVATPPDLAASPELATPLRPARSDWLIWVVAALVILGAAGAILYLVL